MGISVFFWKMNRISLFIYLFLYFVYLLLENHVLIYEEFNSFTSELTTYGTLKKDREKEQFMSPTNELL